MKISDLPQPVVAAKTAWIKSTEWDGFTPSGSAPEAVQRHQGTIERQSRGGYVLEYITEGMDKPNPGFEQHPEYLKAKADHEKSRGRLTGVHRLWRTTRSLASLMGVVEFKLLQDIWAPPDARYRWTAVFLVVERYKILGDPPPKAADVFGPTIYQHLIMHPSSTLRPMTDDERATIADLEIQQDFPDGSAIATQEDAARIPDAGIRKNVLRMMGEDLAGAFEGISYEEKVARRKRAAIVANRFAARREKDGKLACEVCGLDPLKVVNGTGIRPRSLMEAHHKIPLSSGPRFTRESDFALLCPNCHRLEHLRLKLVAAGT